MKSDLIIIGSGPGGYRAAEYAAKNGLQVVIFEDKQTGGTCLNRGCIPTKAMLHEAQMNATANRLSANSDIIATNQMRFQKAFDKKQTIVEQLRSGVEELLSIPGIICVKGLAAFKNGKTVVCNGEEYTAPNIIIATGAIPKRLTIEGITMPQVVTSDELLEVNHIPKRLVIVGAGVIGMEFATVFNQFGSEVTVMEFLKECLPSMDSDIAKRLRKTMEKQGICFHMQAGVTRIGNEGVTFVRKGKTETVPADMVLIATGREPRTDCLNLEAAGIVYDKKGIHVDAQTLLATFTGKTPHATCYAIGDVNGQTLLAHAATMQGLHVVNEILNKEDNIRLDIMPAAVFTTPEAASVGMTEDQCKASGTEYVCKKAFYRANGKALVTGENEGIVKLITDGEGYIIGCHILGAHAADMVQEIAALMNCHATVSQLKDIIHIHPTLGEIIQSAAEQF